MKPTAIFAKFFPLIIIITGFVISTAIWFFEESLYSFAFLKNELLGFITSSLAICLLPVIIYILISQSEKFKKSAWLFSMAGFIPPLVLLVIILL